MDKVNEETVYFHMPEEIKKELKIVATREGRTIKDILNEITEEYVKAHKEGNSQHLLTSYQENEDFIGYPSMAIDFDKKKAYVTKYLQKDGRMNELGKAFWGHVNQWHSEMMKL